MLGAVFMNLEHKFNNLNTPEELMDFLIQNIQYGWIGKDGVLRHNTIKDFRTQYRLSPLAHTLETGVGVCFEQVELEREFFNQNGFKNQSYAIITSHLTHTFLVFQLNGIYYDFEHSAPTNRGIFPSENLSQLLKSKVNNFMENHNIKSIDRIILVPYNKLSDYIDFEAIGKVFLEDSENIITSIFEEENKFRK